MQWNYKRTWAWLDCCLVDLQLGSSRRRTRTNSTSKLQSAAGLLVTHHLLRLSSHCSTHQISKITNRLREGKLKYIALQGAHTNTEPCESNSTQLPEIFTQLNLSKSQFMCQIQCKTALAKLPPSKSWVGLFLLFHINRIIRYDGVGANHIFSSVSLSPKPHLSQF